MSNKKNDKKKKKKKKIKITKAFASLDCSKDNGDKNINNAKIFYENGRLEDALESINKYIDDNPRVALGHSVRGDICAELNQTDEALADYNKAIEINPEYAEAYNNRGVLFEKFSKNNEALDDYSKAIELNSDFYLTYVNRGIILVKLNRNDEALADYNKAIEINPEYADAYVNRGFLFSKLKLYDKALISYNKAIEMNSEYADAYCDRGTILLKLNRNNEALADYNKAIEINPEHAVAYNNRGTLLEKLNKNNEALDDYSKAIEINPEYAEAYNNRGALLHELKKYDEALDDYNMAIKFNPKISIIYENRGLLYENIGKDDKSLDDYNMAIKLNPKNANSFYNRGILLYRLKKNDDALDDFQNAKKLEFPHSELIYSLIKDTKEEIKYTGLSDIRDEIDNIKKLLKFSGNTITHYTGLEATKILLLKKNSKFRLSEGNFLNDSSEGSILQEILFKTNSAQVFTEKPFIASFCYSSEFEKGELVLWRMYSKSNNIDGCGCAISFDAETIINKVKEMQDSIQNIKEKSKNNFSKSLINKVDSLSEYQLYKEYHLYNVAYINNENKTDNPDIDKAIEKIKGSIEANKLTEGFEKIVKERLSEIDYLFKSDHYKYEKEVRLILSKINKRSFVKIDDAPLDCSMPPKVYLETANIQDAVTNIVIGPKVERAIEWQAAFHYKFINKAVKINISDLPYK